MMTLESTSENPLSNDVFRARVRVGVLGEKPGAGKSYEVLGLIAAKRQLPLPTLVENFGTDLITISRSTFPYIDTNLLVIPHNLVSQWQSYCEAALLGTSIKYAFLKTRRHMDAFDTDQFRNGAFSLVVITTTIYDLFFEKLKGLYNGICPMVNRIIYDEFDGIKVSPNHRIEACFFWIVTASWRAVIDPYSRWVSTENLKGTSFLHMNLRKLGNSHIQPAFINELVVKNTDEFVDTCFRHQMVKQQQEQQEQPMETTNTEREETQEVVQQSLVDIFTPAVRTILCRAPRAAHILQGIVGHDILEMINSHNFQGAMESLGVTQVNDENHLIRAVTTSFEQEIERTRAKLLETQERHYQNAELKAAAIQILEVRIKNIVEKVRMIRERLEEKESCAICCGDEIQNRTLLSCCNHSYCFNCIMTWFHTKPNCPMCRIPVERDSILVLNENEKNQNELQDKNKNKDRLNPEFDEESDKIENLTRLLHMMLVSQDSNKKKILLFANNDNPFDKITPVLKSMGITHAALRGNSGAFRNIIQKYTNGGIQVLLMNSKHCGCGLNLQMTTDLVMFHKFNDETDRQIVGRAQRPGRLEQLNLWYLLHQGESETTRTP